MLQTLNSVHADPNLAGLCFCSSERQGKVSLWPCGACRSWMQWNMGAVGLQKTQSLAGDANPSTGLSRWGSPGSARHLSGSPTWRLPTHRRLVSSSLVCRLKAQRASPVSETLPLQVFNSTAAWEATTLAAKFKNNDRTLLAIPGLTPGLRVCSV